jgi:hypothetical protein
MKGGMGFLRLRILQGISRLLRVWRGLIRYRCREKMLIQVSYCPTLKAEALTSFCWPLLYREMP